MQCKKLHKEAKQWTLRLKINPYTLSGRKQLSEALTARGFPIAEATLASMASRGGGPRFSKFSLNVFCTDGATHWYAGKRSAEVSPVENTSELKASAA